MSVWNTRRFIAVLLVSAASVLAAFAAGESAGVARDKGYEVWLVDQSNTNGLAYGGTIYVYDGKELESGNPSAPAPTDIIDLSGATAALCLQETGANPVRPHMLIFNNAETHGALAFVASGHVVIIEAATRQPVACFRMTPGAGGARQAHAAYPTADDRYVLVANQNGKLLERIRTDYENNSYSHDVTATLDLANGLTPNGLAVQDPALRPDNAPICALVASDNGPAFVSLRGGGLFVVDWTTTPMTIVGEYDTSQIAPNGCGLVEAKGWIYANAGGGTPSNLFQFEVYRLPMSGYDAGNTPNTPPRQILYSDSGEGRDAHGPATTRDEKYVWVVDRAADVAEVFESVSGEHTNTVDLTSSFSSKPTVDLIDGPQDGGFFFGSLRGPNPLSGDPHASTGTAPGLIVLKLKSGGKDAQVWRLVPISNLDAGGTERADAHGIAVRTRVER